MELDQAVKLIAAANLPPEKQVWADLGCGNGLFTHALGTLLPPSSSIHCIDRDNQALQNLPLSYGHATIQKTKADFVTNLNLTGLSGIMMANSLHYVKDASAFLALAMKCMTDRGVFIIIEYDTDAPVAHWVPYPLSYDRTIGIFDKLGFSGRRLGEVKSVFGPGKIYAAEFSPKSHS